MRRIVGTQTCLGSSHQAVFHCAPVPIGTLNEGPLHQALKAYFLNRYAPSGRPSSEVAVGDFVADVVGDDGALYEVQTGGFSPIRHKLEQLVASHRVVLVYPIAARRTLVKLPATSNAAPTLRRSPKRGHLAHVIRPLVSIPRLLTHPGFELEVVMTEEDEVRRYDPKRVRRRGGWRVVERRLNAIISHHRFRHLDDLFSLLKTPLPHSFTTRDLAGALKQSRSLGQKMAYVLREAGAIEICGKDGNALVYRRTAVPDA